MDSRKQAPRGRLRVDLPVSLGRLHVAPLLRDYLREWPGVEADVSFSDDYIDLVRDGVDVAIRIGGETDSRLVRRVLAPHRLITCASPALPGPPRRPRRPRRPGPPPDPGLYPRRGAGALALRGRRTGTPGAGGGTAADGQYGSLARRGAGGRRHRPTGRFSGRRDLRAGRLVAVLESVAPAGAPVCAVYPHRRHLAPKVRLLIDGIARAWSAGPPWAADSDLHHPL